MLRKNPWSADGHDQFSCEEISESLSRISHKVKQLHDCVSLAKDLSDKPSFGFNLHDLHDAARATYLSGTSRKAIVGMEVFSDRFRMTARHGTLACRVAVPLSVTSSALPDNGLKFGIDAKTLNKLGSLSRKRSMRDATYKCQLNSSENVLRMHAKSQILNLTTHEFEDDYFGFQDIGLDSRTIPINPVALSEALARLYPFIVKKALHKSYQLVEVANSCAWTGSDAGIGIVRDSRLEGLRMRISTSDLPAVWSILRRLTPETAQVIELPNRYLIRDDLIEATLEKPSVEFPDITQIVEDAITASVTVDRKEAHEVFHLLSVVLQDRPGANTKDLVKFSRLEEGKLILEGWRDKNGGTLPIPAEGSASIVWSGTTPFSLAYAVIAQLSQPTFSLSVTANKNFLIEETGEHYSLKAILAPERIQVETSNLKN